MVLSARELARNQKEYIDMLTPQEVASKEEEMTLPGIKAIHKMDDRDLVDFFTLVLKSRKAIQEIKFTYGENYKSKEQQIRVPNADKLADISLTALASTISMALVSKPNVCGVRAKVELTTDGSFASKVFISLADKKPQGPTEFDNDGNPINGDKEFDPKLIVVSG